MSIVLGESQADSELLAPFSFAKTFPVELLIKPVLFEESPLQLPELPVEQVVGLVD
jgi:hypothetical protein